MKTRTWRAATADRVRGVVAWIRTFGVVGRAFRLLWETHPGYTLGFFVVNVLEGLTPAISLWLTKLVVDALVIDLRAGFVPSATPHILVLVGLLGSVTLIGQVLSPASMYFLGELSDLFSREVNLRIMRKANSFVDISFFESPQFYDFLHRARNEAAYRPVNLLQQVTYGLRTAVSVVSMVALLASLQPLLALGILLCSLPYIIGQFQHQHESWRVASFEVPEVRRMHYFSTVLTNNIEAKEIRLFDLGEFFLGRYRRTWEDFYRRHGDLRRRHLLRDTLMAVLSGAATMASFTYIVLQAVDGHISLGSVALYLGSVSQLQMSLFGLVAQISLAYGGCLFLGDLFAFLALPAPLALRANGRVVPVPLQRGIEFQAVGFRYPGGSQDVLVDMSFRLCPGETVALVGTNGAGKTTLVKLLTRLYDPTDGRILIDGVDLREYDLDGWRQSTAVVFQDFCRFHMTAGENIGVGHVPRMADEAALDMAAAQSGASEIIAELEDGYQTVLGRWLGGNDEGTELSGGQWQKIALARAFLRSIDSSAESAQILILDEPTAALDAEAEYEVYRHFQELTRGKTTLLISHRFSTVKMADRIVVLQGGRIVEQGSHDELVSLGGEYARLYSLQAKSYVS